MGVDVEHAPTQVIHLEDLSPSPTENSSATDQPSPLQRMHVVQSAVFPISVLLTSVNLVRDEKLRAKRSANRMASSAGEGANDSKRAVRKPDIVRVFSEGMLGI